MHELRPATDDPEADSAPHPSAGLSRERLVDAALDLVDQQGLDALTMRALADRLHVKAASLYWHVHDRAELLMLMAAALLSHVHVPPPVDAGSPPRSRMHAASGLLGSRRVGADADAQVGVHAPQAWRADALRVCAALEHLARSRGDAARLLLEAPGAVARSQVHASLAEVLARAGLAAAEASETASMMLSAVLVSALRAAEAPPAELAGPLVLAVDSGSRGVSLRAGSHMSEVIRAAHDRSGFAPAVIHGERVIVRRLRGGRHAELELNPAHPWRVHVQGPTWNTRLDLLGLDVRGIHVDSGAVRVECLLPPPRGSVPIHVSSGVVGLRLRRPPGVAMVADVSPGSVQLRLDDTVLAATAADAHWTSHASADVSDHYALKISSGTVRLSLEQDPTLSPRLVSPPAPPLEPQPGVAAALEVVLDGIAARSVI